MGNVPVWRRRRAAAKGRRGRPWVVAWDQPTADGGLERKQKTFSGPDASERSSEFAAKKVIELSVASPSPIGIDLNITVEDFGKRWLIGAAGGLKPKTLAGYADILERHIVPVIGYERVRDVYQQHGVSLLSALLSAKVQTADGEKPKYKVNTVRHIYATVRRLMERARFEGLIQVNPIRGIWRELPVSVRQRAVGRRKTKEDVKAMTRPELDAFLRACRDVDLGNEKTVWVPDHRDYVLFLTMARTGVRIGEALGLQLEDLGLEAEELIVSRNLSGPREGVALEDRVGTTKSDQERAVDLSPELVTILRAHATRRRAQNLRNGWNAERSPWLFVTHEGTPLSEFNVRRVFRQLLKRAKLSTRFTPHCLRHTYATLMLGAGAPLVWVSKQLGHSSPEVTLSWYAWALPTDGKNFAKLLDAPGFKAEGGQQ